MIGIRLPKNLPNHGEAQLILKDKNPTIANGSEWELGGTLFLCLQAAPQ